MSPKPLTPITPIAAPFAPWPVYAQDEVDAVSAVLQSGKVNYWTGQEGRRFEEEFAIAVGCKYAVALANGTNALELALIALQIPPGSEVITTPRTFIASASSIVLRGCIPVFADVDPDSGNITAESIAKVITSKTRAIIAVHLAGWPCDMDPIMALAEEHDLKVIEDCAQANGATYKAHPVGCIGHVGCFSFCQDKIITTGGEGGMLTTNDEAVWRRAWEYKDHGKSFEAVYHREHSPGFRWLHESFGTNWRMTEMQSAIGRVQLRKLSSWVAVRQANMASLREAFARMPAFRVPSLPSNIVHAAYKAYVYLQTDQLSPDWNRDRVMNEISTTGIPCFSGSCSEIYQEKAFANAGLTQLDPLPIAKDLGETSLMFLVHPTLETQAISETIRIVREVLSLASKERVIPRPSPSVL